jgi:hypothetical protein
MNKKYPRDKDIREHKDRFFTSLVQYFSGLVPIENVEISLRSLMGDASLWVHCNHKELDLEEVKKIIAFISLGGVSKWMKKKRKN